SIKMCSCMSVGPAIEGSIGPLTVRILPARFGIAGVCPRWANTKLVRVTAIAAPSANSVTSVVRFIYRCLDTSLFLEESSLAVNDPAVFVEAQDAGRNRLAVLG